MALRDLFDTDKRSKFELRSEIDRRNEHIEKLLRTVSELRVKNLQGTPQQTKNEHRDVELNAETQSLETKTLEQQNLIEIYESKIKELEGLVDKLGKTSKNIKFELEDERRLRKIETEKSKSEYQKLLLAVNALKQKSSNSYKGTSQINQPQPSTFPTPIQISEPNTSPPNRNNTNYTEAHRVLMQRENRIEEMEQQLTALLFRFGVTDKKQIINIPQRLAEIEQELTDLRQGTEAQELLSLREQVRTFKVLANKRQAERDEQTQLLSSERMKSSSSEAERLRKLFDEAQIEIKRLNNGTSDQVWSLKNRAETAEKLIGEREFLIRNLNLRVGNLENSNKILKAENDNLKYQTISIEAHRKRCRELENAADFEKDLAKDYFQQVEKANRELRSSNNKVGRLQLQLEEEKSKPQQFVTQSVSIFTDPIVLQWLTEEGVPDSVEVPNGWLGRTGDSPWTDKIFASTLEELSYKFWKLPDRDLRHLIVGRKNWSKDELLAQIDSADGETLRIYSQEMFLAKLMTGRDPFDSNNEELLLAFAKGHPALEFLLKQSDPWPTICEGNNRPIDPVSNDDYGVAETPLHLLGYHVGATSHLTERQRREILTECFKSRNLEFTIESSDDYQLKWGRGSSAQRLYRMAIHIKWLAEGQGKDPRKPQARLDWVNDLEWLRKTFHQSMKSRFKWP